jgi:hypothetical protein
MWQWRSITSGDGSERALRGRASPSWHAVEVGGLEYSEDPGPAHFARVRYLMPLAPLFVGGIAAALDLAAAARASKITGQSRRLSKATSVS